MNTSVRIIGGGLAGSEAAWQLARRGVAVELFEMRPKRMTEAHATENLAELVCSNSFRSGSLAAPAGSALAVDRDSFSRSLTAIVEALPSVRIMREEIREIPAQGVIILATG